MRNSHSRQSPDLFHPDASRVKALHVRDNVAYTDVWKCILCGDVPAGWENRGNSIKPYRRAPAETSKSQLDANKPPH